MKYMPNALTVFVDTNVLLYAQDPRDAGKQRAAQTWLAQCWRRECGRISTQVLNEMYANLQRVAPSIGPAGARDVSRRYRAWKPWLVDESTIDLAWLIQDGHAVSYWDALMVAAAIQQGCSLLLTEDLQHGQQIDAVRITSPFLVGPEILDA
jgi:predicted nucleic acid-binding protein